MKVAVVDTETTGFKKPIVPIEVCFITLTGTDPRKMIVDGEWVRRFNPGKEIEYGAMCTHLISDKQVHKNPKWGPGLIPEAEMYIGHSIDYDYEALGSPAGVKYRVCTHALAKRAFPDVDSHKLGALLIYVLGAERAIPLLKDAHSSLADATNCLHLLQKIVEEWEVKTWADLYELSETCRVPTHMGFGKYGPDPGAGKPGMPIEEMVRTDMGYVRWLQRLPDLDPYLRKAIANAGG